jgi:hypothetical protein
MTNQHQPYMTVRVDPNDMLQYVHTLMASPQLAELQWGGDQSRARAAELRWNALNRAFRDPRVGSWMMPQKKPSQFQVPAALVAAAGVARLTMEDDDVVFDIPALLDVTLELCEPVGRA